MNENNKKYPRIDCIDHIECIIPENCDLKDRVNRILKSVFVDGREAIYVMGQPQFSDENPMKGMVLAMGCTEGVQVVAAMDNREELPHIGSFYPVGLPLNSVQRRRGICDFYETECDLEAYGALRKEGLRFSVANYPSVKEMGAYKNVGEFNVDLVGFCYLCKRIDGSTQKEGNSNKMTDVVWWYDKLSPEDRATIEKSWGEKNVENDSFDSSRMKYLSQINTKFPDEFHFSSPVFDVDEVVVFGLPMYRMKILSKEAHSEAEVDEYITVYAKMSDFPKRLQIGDFVKGVGWLQGVVG